MWVGEMIGVGEGILFGNVKGKIGNLSVVVRDKLGD
jgi:hypothetical protein